MEKRKWLFKAVIAALLSVSAVGVATSVSDNTQPAQAAKATYNVSLKRNSYVYNKRGFRKGKMKLKKGQFVTTYGVTTIKGKKFYHLSKSRYIKMANVVNKALDQTNVAPNKETSLIQLTKEAPIYNANGKPTGTTFKKGLVESIQGQIVINGKQYYKLKGQKYISVSDAVLLGSQSAQNDPNTNTSNQNGNNTGKEIGGPNKPTKPTPEEIAEVLSEKNDAGVYFTDDQLAQIKTFLWEKIQNYRVENGYPRYKSNSELDSFINKVSSTTDNMFIYSEDINNGNVEKYLPTLAGNGMRAVQAFDNYKYYGNYIGAPAVFNFRDRNPEHVATEIFNSLKADPFYDSKILGEFDVKSFGSLGLNYNWDGNYSTVGLVFIEVAGKGATWTSFYNAN